MPGNFGTLALRIMSVVGSSLGKGGAVLLHLAGFGDDSEGDSVGPTTESRPRAEDFANGVYARTPSNEMEPSEVVAAELGDDKISIGVLDRDSIRLANFGRSTPYPQPGQRVVAGFGGATLAYERRPGTREDDVVVTVPYQRNGALVPSARHVVKVGDVDGAPGCRIETGRGLRIDLVGDQITVSATGMNQSIRVASSGRVAIESPDVRIGPGAGRQVACVGDMIAGSVAAICASPGSPLVPNPAGTPTVPVAGRIISGSANVRAT